MDVRDKLRHIAPQLQALIRSRASTQYAIVKTNTNTTSGGISVRPSITVGHLVGPRDERYYMIARLADDGVVVEVSDADTDLVLTVPFDARSIAIAVWAHVEDPARRANAEVATRRFR